jgi:gluconolactonase
MQDCEILDPRFRRYLLGNARLEQLVTGCRWTEGPVWVADNNCLLFSDIPNNRVLRWIEGYGLSVFRQPADFANGHTRDHDGRLLTCSHGKRALCRTEPDGTDTILAERFNGKRLNSPNDATVKSDGTIWFTDPHYGISSDYEGARAEQELPCNVYRFDPVTGHLRVVAEGIAGPNGICFSPDESRLYVADTGRFGDESADRHIRLFDVLDDGTIANERRFHTVVPEAADGMRCDEDGNLWTSAGDGVHCLSPDAELLGKILVPERVANITFGGPRRNRLFICASTSVYSVYVNARGVQRP